MRVLLCYINVEARRFFPIGVGTLVSYLKSKSHKVEVFDTSFYKESFLSNARKFSEKIGIYKPVINDMPIRFKTAPLIDDLYKKIENFKPQLIGISLLSVHFDLAKQLGETIKKKYPQIPIICGGIHPTIAPNEVIKEKFVDIICIGEGEEALSELCEKLEKKMNITKIKNLWVKKDNIIHKNDLREFINLDKVPRPDWGAFEEQHIYAPLYGKMYRMGPVMFNRGCPYSCSYCINHKLQRLYHGKGNYCRKKSINKVISDLVYYKSKYNIEMFYIMDETFLTYYSIEELEKLKQKYLEKINVPFFIQTHPCSVNEEKIRILKEMGCFLATIGIENGNYNIRKNVLNRIVVDKMILNAFKIFKKYKIKTSAFNMIGIPFETRKDIMKTIKLNRKCKPDSLSVSYFFPFKGTNLRKLCLRRKYIDGKEKPNDLTAVSVLKMPQISRKELSGLYRTFSLYCRMPKIFFPILKICEKENMFSNFLYKLFLKISLFY